MSTIGYQPSGTTTTGANAGTYGRGDLQAAFNWLVNQPEHIRKQASDPDRLMTLYYRSSGRIENEAPVSGQTFISDLRQINEALRQFDGPTAQATIHTPLAPPQPVQVSVNQPPPTSLNGPILGKVPLLVAEVREKLNLSTDAEALNVLVSLGYRSLKPLLA